MLRRNAFTLVELARESARRMTCQNNLKQLGLALQAYHDNQRAFPAGYISAVDGAGDDTGPGWGWATKALPFLEQLALYDSIRTDQPIEGSINRRTYAPTIIVILI